MPEELAIAIVVLVIAIWIIAKIFQALVRGADKANKTLGQAILQSATRHRLRKKARLAPHVRIVIPNQLEGAQRQVVSAEAQFQRIKAATRWNTERPAWTKAVFTPQSLPSPVESYEEMDAEDIPLILVPNVTTWSGLESKLINEQCVYPFPPPRNRYQQLEAVPTLKLDLDCALLEHSEPDVSEKQVDRYFANERKSVGDYNQLRSHLIARRDALNSQITEWNQTSRLSWEAYVRESERLANEEMANFKLASDRYVTNCREQRAYFKTTFEDYKTGTKNGIIARTNHVLGNLALPRSVPRMWDIDFDEDHRILVIETALPDVVHRSPFKTVLLKIGLVRKPLNQTERKEVIPKVHPAILLRFAFEVFRNDIGQVINLLVINGWVKFDDPKTGIDTKAYTSSLMVERSQVVGLNLTKIDPLAAFDNLHGKSAGKLVEIVPIEPTLSLNKKDSRFVDARAVLNTLGTTTNLAAMDWQDFEHLIRELFEREFASRGAEVKITQASRDRGVDAIVFDPDPIHGGKYVIQAKRYTNTVDVSSVRDLCAVVKKEGASRGILVTTSTYGADAYSFANNEPVTLLNGAELLGLLRKHGYSFRINLQEARRVVQMQNLPQAPRGESE
jgi:restriction system protein